MQSANIAVKHAFNCIVIMDCAGRFSGDNVWILYYGNQGLISVAGFNFVQDLPRFLVLLYTPQRFNLEDWGRNTAFKPHLEGDHIVSHTIKVDGRTLKLDNRERDTRLRLAGRGTSVMDVTCEALKQEKPADTVDGMVAKIYWTEEARITEEEILERVKEAGKKFEDVRGHVPILLFSKRFLVSTSTIRRALGLKDPEKGSRRLVLLVFKKLSPIEELQGDELVDAWRQCVLCHYALWWEGIHHRDVSSGNLMYYRVDGKVMGVLNDYDLSSLTTSANSLGNEPTGTIPFMAIDLLKKDGQDGRVEHLYRHDMESLIYVFIWISLQYKDGKLIKRGPLRSWAKVNARGCAEKNYFLTNPEVPLGTNNRNLVFRLVAFLSQRLNTRDRLKIAKDIAQLDLEDARSETAIEDARKAIAELDRNLEEQPDSDMFDAFLSKIPSVN
ncbi:hypothetical protein BKA82DRAFT_131896 [Pisolithus tinctorius]|uniref:Fungal-type protein kinase domain-containing protein n=1 Tax=Pisolithus tinctorius Marx 270 TaxID=870435 RepID=A0A0C3JKV9_PISTI|nr:hypothetical protein BKA82DRAFT_131896 [Pisolithus tinctorius]KIO09763.1 hypothetical protein M404DRAFT_131896 [Pisolithus tinctorius Marx 270]